MSRELRFDQATGEQFFEFWKAQGFKLRNGGADKDCRFVGKPIRVHPSGYVLFGDEGVIFPTFGQALDAANQLANTELFGGWVK